MTFNPKHWFRWYLRLPKLYSIGGAVAFVAVVAIGGNAILRHPASSADQASETSHVSVASVASLASAAGPLPVTGKVTSLSEATILAQTSGELVTLTHSIGDHVAAGALIGAFENSSQQAAVLQAQGAYDAAAATLARVSGSSSENTSQAALTALASGSSSLDDAIHTRADALFSNARTDNPHLILTVPDSTLVASLERERVSVEPMLADVHALANTTSPDAVPAASQKALADTQAILAFLDDLIKAVNETPPSQDASASTLSGYQTSLATARSEVVAVLSGITTAKSAYDANDVAAAQASVKQAQGALDAAKAALDKTLVRSPIGGTIVSLPVTQGDFVSAFSQVAIVSNPGALYVDVQVTPSDAKSLSTGNAATIDDGIHGVITFVAPALDPATNKIEVKVGIKGDASTLTDGEVVSVALDRNEKSTTDAKSSGKDIVIPIIAAKITPSGPIVFTVTASSTLSSVPITLGSILGDRIQVRSGLSLDTEIVTDARGLAEGQTVIVDQN